jgi:hypothetical protein
MKKIMFNDKYGLTQAVLEGRKTQTRRIITCHQTFKGQYVAGFHVYKQKSSGFISEICMYDEDERDFDEGQIVPMYKIGEIVAIAQSYENAGTDPTIILGDGENGFIFNEKGWTNKMFIKPELMPHQIRITNIRIERLQDISDEDCLKEGIITCDACGKCYFLRKDDYDDCSLSYNSPRKAYAVLIDKVGKKGDWERNPFVFVYDFKLVK